MNDNMTVQWFPGHMAKTRRKIKESLHMVDAVAELRDARIPESSKNPELAELIEGKPRMVLLNKCDLADEKATALWMRTLEREGAKALAIDCRSGKGVNGFHNAVRALLEDKIRQNTEKGMPGKALRVMVVGIPNTGKSSFINRLAGKNRAQVADKPGVTRHNQWFNIGDGIELLDTPGVLWPKFEDPAVGDKLAFVGSVKDTILDSETMAMRLLEVLKVHYADRLTMRYGIQDFEALSAWEVLELIGRRRGMLISGGEINTERASVMLMDEYRGGKLGRITLEYPERED